MSIGSSYPVGRSTPGPQPARPLPHARASARLGLRLLGAALCGAFAVALTAAVLVRTRSGQWLDGVLLPRVSWENARLHRHGERRGSLVAGNGSHGGAVFTLRVPRDAADTGGER